MANPVLEATRKERDKAQKKIDKLMLAPTSEERTLTAEEATKFEELAKSLTEFDKQIKGFEKEEKRAEKAAAAAAAVENPAPVGGAVVRSESMTYDQYRTDMRNGGTSWFLDMAFQSAAGLDASYSGRAAEARGRLAQHAKEVDIELRSATAAERRSFDNFLDRTGASYEQRVNPNTTAGTGGEFVPPLWLVSQFAPFKRATRTFANRCVNMALPGGINVINVPKIGTGSLTAPQVEAAGVTSRDIVTTSVSAAVRTIAGQQDISMQLLEQSPLAMDQVVFQDLTRDYDKQLDTQILVGTNANGQHNGILSLASATVANNTVNSSSTSQVPATSTIFNDQSTTATQYRAIWNAINQVESLYFDSPTAIWVHPRRANSWGAAADTTGRNLFIPAKYGQYNVAGLNESVPTAQGFAGELAGLPVFKDANMPVLSNGFSGTTLTLTGGSQDPIIVADESQLWLWEGTLRLRALPEILSGTIQVRYQAYAYSALLANRFPTAISIIAGAGVASPGF
jgi:HK97 family phage major capsid protein